MNSPPVLQPIVLALWLAEQLSDHRALETVGLSLRHESTRA